MTRVLAVDYGLVRTGLALSDTTRTIPGDSFVLRQPNVNALVREVSALCAERNVGEVVVGLPLSRDSGESELSVKARAFAQLLRESCGLPVVMRDERFTTAMSHSLLTHLGRRGQKQVADAVSAEIILQEHLAAAPKTNNTEDNNAI